MAVSILSFVFDHFGTVLGSSVALYFVFHAIYQLYFSPLKNVPGPWYAAVSNAWITSHVFRLQQCKIIHSLFEVYGPIVRIAPNKVAYNDVATNKRVYFSTKFNNSSFYKSLLTNDNNHAMTMLPHSDHVVRRKAYASHYTPSNLALFQPEIQQYALQLVDILVDLDGKSPVDCLHVFRQMIVDIQSAIGFGIHLGALDTWAKDGEHPLVMAVDDFPKRGVIRGIVPTWAWDPLCSIPNKRWQQLCDSDKIMARFIGNLIADKRASMKDGKLQEVEKRPLVYRLMEYRLPSGELMEDKDIVSEHMGHFIAGTDTTSTTLSYLFWELSRRPDISKKLHAELDSALPDGHRIPDINVLYSLPYLNAVIKETLRIYGSGPSLLERIVPSVEENGVFDVLGVTLPPDTIVGTQAWSMHRNSKVFPSPETYLPDRWLDADSAELAAMEQSLMPFGNGTRLCGGVNLAHIMLRIETAAIARNFEVSAPPETNERSMDIRDSFVIFPAAMRCLLTFTPRK
ncbi:cytochrome P450 [Amylostereum chailletii]|nr:cytochrome P450 [Amylostereum chailletii]